MIITKATEESAILMRTVNVIYKSIDDSLIINTDIMHIIPKNPISSKEEVEVSGINSIIVLDVLITDSDKISEFIEFSEKLGLTYLKDLETSYRELYSTNQIQSQ